MATFQFEAMNSVGDKVKGEVDASSKDDAIAKIRAMGNFPSKVREKAAAASKSSGRSKKAKAEAAPKATGGKKRRRVGKVKVKTLTQFTRQLSTLQDAGLPILRSLRILEQQQKPGALKNALGFVADDVEGGATLSEAMAKHPRAFDRLYTNMVQAGEAGGVLDVILQRLAEFMEKAQRLRRKVIGAMIYPIAVISFSSLIVMGIMIVVIPKFEEIFSDFGVSLPLPTMVLMKMSNWIAKQYGWAVILAIPVIMIFINKLICMSQGGRYVMDVLKMHTPIMGQIVTKSSIARFTRTLGTLIAAGVPILEALNITRDTSGNEVYAKALGEVHDAIREGESFAGPLRQAKVVDSMVVNMIDVGEETGDLDKMLMKIADNYDGEVETLVESLVSLLEPVMVIVLGGIVGFIVLALFMPMVSIITSMTG